MKLLILAAGRGSRLLELTQDKPKSFVHLWNKKIIEWILLAITKHTKLENISVVTGYKSECFDCLPINKILNCEWQTSNMVYSFYLALEWIGEADCAITYSDIVFNHLFLEKFQGRDEITLLSNRDWLSTWQKRMPEPLSDLETFSTNEDAYLIEIGKKPSHLNQIMGQFMGLIFIPSSKILEIKKFMLSLPLEKIKELDFTSFLNLLLEHKFLIKTISCKGDWVEIDTPSDLKIYNELPMPDYLHGLL